MWLEIIILVIVGIVSAYIGYRASEIISKNRTIEKDKVIKTLYRQCSRWSSAAIQDQNPLVATLHSNYAAGYLWGLEDVFTSDEISKATGIDHKEFRAGIQQNQDLATKTLIQACPNFAKEIEGSSTLVTKVAGEF